MATSSALGSPPSGQDVRGSGYPGPHASPPEIVRYVQRLLTDSQADAEARYKRATQNLLFSDGRQHVDWSLRDKMWRDTPTIEGRVRVTMNHIRPVLRSRQQRMQSGRITWQIIPRSNEHEERDRAQVGETVLTNRYEQTEMEAKVGTGLWLAFNTGVSFLKPFWNPAIGPLTAATVVLPHPLTQQPTEYPVDAEGNVLADDRGDPLDGTDLAFTYRPGDTDTALRTVFNIRVNPGASGFEPADGFRWLLDSETVPIHLLRELWGDRATKVQPTSGLAMLRNYENIVRSLAQRPGSAGAGGDLLGRDGEKIPDNELTLLTEYWEAPSELYPAGRFCIVAGEELLYPLEDDEIEAGLPQGFVPHIPIYDERRPLDAMGRPSVDDLIPPQKVINRQWGAIIEEMQHAGIGQWMMFDVPGLSDQITNYSGAHVRIPLQSAIANRSIDQVVKRVDPAVVAPDRWRLIEQARAAMWDIGAYHEIQRGQVPPGVDSGIAIQLLQEAENGQLAPAVRNLERSLIRWARHTLKLARWGYGEDEERWLPQHRPDLGYLIQSVRGPDLPDPDQVDIRLDGFRPTSQAAFNAELKDAMKEGWIPPRDGLRLMDLGRGVEGAFESQTRHYARARRENLALEQGAFVTVTIGPDGQPAEPGQGMPAFVHPDGGSFLLPQDDDHLVHIDVHQEIALDDTRPLDVRQAALLHANEHRMVMVQQTMAAQQAMAAADPNAKSPEPATATPG